MNRLDVSSVKTGMRFSKPVFFDDGKNMFIESGITVKPYHLASLTRWNIPYLLTDGYALADGEEVPIDEIEAVDDMEELTDADEAEEIEEIEDAEEAEEIEDIEEL